MKVDRVINQAIWEHQANTKGFPNNEYLIDLEKIRKALEIIKKRECLFKGLSETTQEEYDLLKEIFL